ncbi:MAG: S9 family peptidase, partial [Gammaproteobacteria bacterium]|nr:S9 family peptidase [Gammaproteobacteria bacterium]
MSLPPAAKTKPHLLNSAHGTRTDPYFWLRDDERKNPEVLEYLHAEKTYADQSTLHLQSLQDRLYQEINSRIEKDDTSVPYFYKGYFYQTRYEGEDEYPIYARRYKTLDSPEEILLNGNELAKGHDFYDIGDYDVTLDNKLMAWTEDTTGRRIYTIRFRDLQTGEILPDHINGTQSSIVWADDNKTLFYIEKDPETLLGIKVRRHTLGTSPADDALVYEEADDSFYMSLSRTGDDYYIVLSLSSTVSDEMQFLPANDAKSNFTVLLPRQRDHEYDADHLGTEWVI